MKAKLQRIQRLAETVNIISAVALAIIVIGLPYFSFGHRLIFNRWIQVVVVVSLVMMELTGVILWRMDRRLKAIPMTEEEWAALRAEIEELKKQLK